MQLKLQAIAGLISLRFAMQQGANLSRHCWLRGIYGRHVYCSILISSVTLMPFSLQSHNTIRMHGMSARHWSDVRAIYKEALSAGCLPGTAKLPTGTNWDKLHLPHSRFVATSIAGEVLGWAALRSLAIHDFPAGVAEATVFVACAAQGQGVGRQLLASLIAASEANGIWTLQVSTLGKHPACRRLYEGAGFREVGRRERIDQVHGVWRDLVLLERRSAVVGTEDLRLLPYSSPMARSYHRVAPAPHPAQVG